MDNRFEKTRELAENVATEMTTERAFDGIKTGISLIDHEIGGLRNGELSIIAGPPGAGKTALGLTLVENITVRDHRTCLYITVNEGDYSLMEKLILMVGEVAKLKNHRREPYTEQETDRIRKAAKEICASPLVMEYTPGGSYADIKRDTIMTFINAEKPFLLVVDGLDVSRKTREKNDHAGVVWKLKRSAQELNCPVLLLSKTTMLDFYQSEHLYPCLNDLDRSAVAAADQVFILHREEYVDPDYRPKGHTNFIIEKSRYARNCMLSLWFNKEYGRFTDLPAQEAVA